MFIWAGPPVGTSGGQVRSRRDTSACRHLRRSSSLKARHVRLSAPPAVKFAQGATLPPVGTSGGQVRSRRDAPSSRWNLRYEIFGEKVVAAEMVSMLNDKFFGQWLALHVPFRQLDDLLVPEIPTQQQVANRCGRKVSLSPVCPCILFEILYRSCLAFV